MSVSIKSPNFVDLVSVSLSQIDDPDIKEIYVQTYASHLGLSAISAAQSAIDLALRDGHSIETKCKFIAGWRAIHGTSNFVAALIVRLHRMADEARELGPTSPYRIASKLGYIIAEDIGLNGRSHDDLFAIFGGFYASSDDWALPRYEQSACLRFRQYNEDVRLRSDIPFSLLALIASESWNSAEFNYFFNSYSAKLDSLEESAILEGELEYLEVHAGKAEDDHMHFAISAFHEYCSWRGITLDKGQIRASLVEYLENITLAYLQLCGLVSNCTEG